MENENLIKALILAKKDFKAVKKTSDNPFFHSKYADLQECIDATEEALNKNGLVVIQFPISKDDKIGVSTILAHESGESIQSEYLGTPVKNDPQGAGSLITYFRRYSYMAVLGIAPEDDDGNAASKTEQPKTAKNVQVNKPGKEWDEKYIAALEKGLMESEFKNSDSPQKHQYEIDRCEKQVKADAGRLSDGAFEKCLSIIKSYRSKK